MSAQAGMVIPNWKNNTQSCLSDGYGGKIIIFCLKPMRKQNSIWHNCWEIHPKIKKSGEENENFSTI